MHRQTPTSLRLESHKISDKQCLRMVGQIDTDGRQNHNKNSGESSTSYKSLQHSINILSDQVKKLKMHNGSNRKFVNGKPQNNTNYGENDRLSRPNQNNHPHQTVFMGDLKVVTDPITFSEMPTQVSSHTIYIPVQMPTFRVQTRF